jgi:pyrimidine-nucleoside phosphorylase
MRAVDIIIKKRDKHELTREEIQFFVEGYTRDEIPEYQAAAWAMAVLLNGMNARETSDLTLAMAHSGKTLDLSQVVPIAVDKHSTGGVGDKTSLVVVPVVAACGLPVGKMSGRGLGFSGGTLDKLESIPGFRTDLSTQEFLDQLGEVGLVITGQTMALAPADGKLYALRDVTGTVRSIPLIASSIMSKKIASGVQAVVLDVKIGLGAFMHTLEDARRLSELMVSIADHAGQKAVAVVSDMNQPLGQAVGNALEVREAINTLQGGGPDDFRQHCLEIAAHMLMLGGKAENEQAAKAMVRSTIQDGAGWQRFRDLVEAQDGDLEALDHPERLPSAPIVETVPAPRSGYLRQVHARKVGEIAMALGAGRLKIGQPIDHGVGILVHRNVGDYVDKGEPLVTIHARDRDSLERAKKDLLEIHQWSDEAVEALPVFYDVIHA